jgi:hypothetical protein
MTLASRSCNESPLAQGEDEVLAYDLTTTPWVSSPTSPVVKLYEVVDEFTRTDKSATMLSGSASVSGDVITTPLVTGLTAGTLYRLEIKWTVGSKVYEAWALITAEY